MADQYEALTLRSCLRHVVRVLYYGTWGEGLSVTECRLLEEHCRKVLGMKTGKDATSPEE